MGPLRHLAPLEEAIRLADAHGEVDLAVHARARMVRGAFFSSSTERAFVEFAWIRAAAERDGLHAFTGPLIDGYFYVAQAAPLFPSITRGQIESVLAEMEEDFERLGFDVEAPRMMQLLASLRMGDVEESARNLQRWREARESSWRCEDCVADLEAHCLFVRGLRDEGIARALPTIRRRPECDGGCNVPVAIVTRVLVPLCDAGRHDEAAEFAKWALPRVSRYPDDLSLSGQLLEYLALVGRAEQAVPVIEHTVAAVDETLKDWYVLHWLLGLTRIANRTVHDGANVLPVRRLPERLDLPTTADGYDAEGVAETCEREARELAARFDERNGNDFHTGWIAEGLERSFDA